MIIETFTTIFTGITYVMNLRAYKTIDERRKALENNLGVVLLNIGKYDFDPRAETQNCENMIGSIKIPLGVAGPLKVQSSSIRQVFDSEVFDREVLDSEARTRRSQTESAQTRGAQDKVQSYYIPLATTEGALVASINRGCKAVTRSGGATTASYNVGATRGPVFYTGNIRNEQRLYSWVKKNEEKIKKAAESTSKHLRYKKLIFRGLAEYAFIRFAFDTQDAMGMNMATIATEKIVELIEKETGISCISLAGNFDADKKPAWINFIENRGHKVWAEATVSKRIVSEVLKTTPQKIYEVWLSKNMLGSAMSGSLGFNAHFANIVSAIFIATGQDPAHVVEASMGVTTARVTRSGDIYFSIYIPSLMVGTVGGGTSLETQKEALSIMGIVGGREGKNSQKLAEIIGGGVLVGELSLLASLAEGSLASAHRRLGRGGK